LTGTNVGHSQSVLRDRCLRQEAIAQQKAASGEARGGRGRANGSGDDHYSAAMVLRCRRRIGGGALAFSRAARRLDRSETGSCAYQLSSNFEPSAAAVIIAGIPIATVASAIARASIMCNSPLIASSSTTDRELETVFPMTTARLLQAYFAAKILVSWVAAIIGPAFRGLWQ
jgi:hypothetical protein